MNEPLISIVIPAWHADATLGTAMASVFSQTFRDWELLLVDDGASEETEALFWHLAEKALSCGISRSKLYYLKNSRNLGAAASRNRGALEARGKWIAFLDADDAWEKTRLEKQLALLEKNPDTLLLFTGSAFMDASGRPLSGILHVPASVGYRGLLNQNVISCSSVLVQREAFLAHPMPEVRGLHEDYACWLELLRSTGRPALGVDEPLLIYRVSAGSQSGNKLRAALMNWRVYRRIGLSLPAALYHEFRYALNGLLKWRRILGGK